MGILVVPKGLLVARNPLEAGLDVASASRPIDHVPTSAERAILVYHSQRVSIDLGGLARTRETGHEFRLLNSMPISRRVCPSRISEELVDPIEPSVVSRHISRHTISYSALERCDTSGNSIPSLSIGTLSSAFSSTSTLLLGKGSNNPTKPRAT
jgi:hypothetical protein